MTDLATIEQLIELKRFTEAKELIHSAMAEFPQDAQMHSFLCACFGGLGQPEEAIGAANRAIAMDYGNPEYHRQRAVMLSVSGYHEDAEESFVQALSLDPTSVHLKAAYAEALQRDRRSPARATSSQSRNLLSKLGAGASALIGRA